MLNLIVYYCLFFVVVSGIKLSFLTKCKQKICYSKNKLVHKVHIIHQKPYDMLYAGVWCAFGWFKVTKEHHVLWLCSNYYHTHALKLHAILY